MTEQSIGADRVIDCKTTEWTATNDIYDVILDTGGTHAAFSKVKKRLTANGIYIDTFPDGARLSNQFTALIFSRQRCAAFMLETDAALLQSLAGWAANGVLQPRVAERITLEQVPQALTRMEAGKVQGKVVVTIA